MADYVRLTGTPHYIGAASDTKPTSCPSGSRCYEHDTQKWYITYDGGTNWPAMATQVVQGTAANLNATVTPVSWLFSVEMAVGTTVIKAAPGQLHGVLIETDGTNDVYVQLFNHASNATNPMTPNIHIAGADNYGGALGIDCAFALGCVIVLSGTNGVATVYYR